MEKQVFINLPVKDLAKSVAFYEGLGFSNNPQFSDATAACMIWSEHIYVMLLTHDKLRQFTTKEIVDAKKYIGAINCLSLSSAAEVNQITEAALAAGGVEPDEPKDYGFMQQRSFEDLDGNHWEVMYMDMEKFPTNCTDTQS